MTTTVQSKCKQCGRLMEWEIDSHSESFRMMKMLLAIGLVCNECMPEAKRLSARMPERIGKDHAAGNND